MLFVMVLLAMIKIKEKKTTHQQQTVGNKRAIFVC